MGEKNNEFQNNELVEDENSNEIYEENRRVIQDESNKRKTSNLKTFFVILLSFLVGAMSVFGTQYYILGHKSVLNSKVASKEQEEDNEQITIRAISKAKDAVVSVVNYQKNNRNNLSNILERRLNNEGLQPISNGSGVIYKKDNNSAYIVTNEHVIKGAQKLAVILSDDTVVDAELVGSDIWTDLAVLKINSKGVKVIMDFADSNNVAVGETALAIGSPLGVSLSNTVTKGIVSAVNRQIPIDIDKDKNYDWYQTVIQTDAAINPGNSGGALINNQGELIGINELKISEAGADVSAEGIGFVIPSNEVKIITEQLEKIGKVNRPILGIQLAPISTLNPELVNSLLKYSDKKGVVIKSVEPGGPAEKANLKEYDIITKINDLTISNGADLRKYIFDNLKIGDEVTVTYFREGKEYSTKLILGQLN